MSNGLSIPATATGLRDLQAATNLGSTLIDAVANSDDVDYIEDTAQRIEVLQAAIKRLKPDFHPPINQAYKFARMRLGQLTPKDPGGRPDKLSDQDDSLSAGDRNRRWENAGLAEFWDHEEIGSVLQGGGTPIKTCMDYVTRLRAQAKGRQTNRNLKNVIHYGQFQEVAERIKPNSVDLIFADPPWDGSALPMYEELANIAARILLPGGSMLIYSCSQLLYKTIPLVCVEGLRFYGCCYDIRENDPSKLARLNRSGIVVRCMPMIWMVKGSDRDTSIWVTDGVISAEEKDHHNWQQSSDTARYYIETLSKPKGTVFDPFCGGGTTAAVCKELGRSFITCDIDEAAIASAEERIS